VWQNNTPVPDRQTTPSTFTATDTSFKITRPYSKSRDNTVGIAIGYEGVSFRVPVGLRIFSSPRRPEPVTVSEWSKTWTALARLDAGIVKFQSYLMHGCLCVRLFYVCVILCRSRSCDELITRLSSPTDCPRLRNWSETESFIDAPWSSRSQKGNKKMSSRPVLGTTRLVSNGYRRLFLRG
jgi:hypothetical protein